MSKRVNKRQARQQQELELLASKAATPEQGVTSGEASEEEEEDEAQVHASKQQQSIFAAVSEGATSADGITQVAAADS